MVMISGVLKSCVLRKLISMKKLIMIVMLMVLAYIAYKYFYANNENIVIPHSEKEWSNKYPQIFANAGYNKLATLGTVEEESEIKTIKELTLTEKVIGPISNKFGIGDDMLAYIMKTIPASNESAVYAAIRLAQLNQTLILSETQEEALINVKKMDVSVHCLDKSLDYTNPFIKNAGKLMTNTPDRKKQDQKISSFLAWQMIGIPDLSVQQLDKMCLSGDY